VSETKSLLNVLVLYLPIPLFWALFNQQGSRWTEQAKLMRGKVAFFTIEPDQIQMANPLLILVFIPLYEYVLYPLLDLIGIRRPLQKMTLGGVLAGVAFLLSMVVQLNMDKAPANSVSMLWQLPQYAVMTLAEVSCLNFEQVVIKLTFCRFQVMFSVTGLEFSFTQAPENMKSVLQGFWMVRRFTGLYVESIL
jgi:dipeptide/tripeptide permease